jgi:hypothetical protein
MLPHLEEGEEDWDLQRVDDDIPEYNMPGG